MTNWEIHDNNGVLQSGLQSEIQLIWDLTTKDLTDLANEYRAKYSRSTLKAKIADNAIKEWVGQLKLIEIHNTYK